MKKPWALVFLLGACVLSSGAAAPVVSNVRASQRPGTALVDIYYDVSDADSSSLAVGVAVSTNDGASYDLPASSFSDGGVTKSVGSGVGPGNNRWIVWNAGADWNGQFSSLVKFQVTSDDSSTAGDYMVIDLSAGPEASSYPVSYLTAVPGGGWSDIYKTTRLVMRRIPAGTFTMGSPTDELGRGSTEPQHSVTLTKDFYIGVFETTQKQWERVMGDWPSYFANAAYRDSRPVERVSYYDIRENPANSDDPAVYWPSNSAVNADSFMGRLRARTGQTFDLPTEAQWEYACRAGTTTALNSGFNLTDQYNDVRMSEVGRYYYNLPGGFSTNSGVGLEGGSTKAGSYLPNAWGLYDMHGNVWEWCLDWYVSSPAGALDPPGAVSGSFRVYRGGSWDGLAGYCRSALRNGYYPGYRRYYGGFRPAMTLP